MKKITKHNERKIWNYIHKKQPVGVNKIVRDTGISKPTVIKILTHFKEMGEINYPKQKIGKKSLITLKKTEFSKIFSRVKKQGSFLSKPDLPVIVETFYGTYAGLIDAYKNRTLNLFLAHEVVKKKWQPMGGNVATPNWLYVPLEDIDKIYTINTKALGLEAISLPDMMDLWFDLTHEPLRGIKCNWDSDGKPHSKECQSRLHESLSNIFMHIMEDRKLEKEKGRELRKSIHYVLESFVDQGVKIPWRNF